MGGCSLTFSYFCKNNVGVCIYMTEIKLFIELTDKNGNLHRYNLIPYAILYNNFISQYIESIINKIYSYLY